jgi:hypothetical protein
MKPTERPDCRRRHAESRLVKHNAAGSQHSAFSGRGLHDPPPSAIEHGRQHVNDAPGLAQRYGEWCGEVARQQYRLDALAGRLNLDNHRPNSERKRTAATMVPTLVLTGSSLGQAEGGWSLPAASAADAILAPRDRTVRPSRPRSDRRRPWTEPTPQPARLADTTTPSCHHHSDEVPPLRSAARCRASRAYRVAYLWAWFGRFLARLSQQPVCPASWRVGTSRCRQVHVGVVGGSGEFCLRSGGLSSRHPDPGGYRKGKREGKSGDPPGSRATFREKRKSRRSRGGRSGESPRHPTPIPCGVTRTNY